MPYGAFVELVPGVEGMVHISELSWSRIEAPQEVANPGDQIEVKVLRIEPGDKQMKIALSAKQVTGNPWERMGDDVTAGQKVTGKVTRCAPFGAFVEIMPGIEGLVHISEMSYAKRVLHPEEIVQPGQTVSVMIKEVDSVKRRVGLSIRDAEGDPWLDVQEKFTAGQPVRARVEKLEKFGIFIELSPGIVGLLPQSVIKASAQGAQIRKLQPGDAIDVVIERIRPQERRISLALGEGDDESNWRQFKNDRKGGNGGLGALGDKLAEALKKKD
jgi:small subunit ribosomal protein S1